MERITVIGGGIAGLAVAAGLDPQRWDVTIIEAEPDRPPAGTALAMWPTAMAALETVGAADAVRANSIPLTDMTVRDVRGRIIGRAPTADSWLINRPELLAALRGAVPESVTHLSASVTDPIAAASQTAADLVIGADGVHSVVRRSLWPETAARKVGYLALRGISPEQVCAMREFWHETRLCGLSETADGRSNWYLAGRVSEIWPGGDQTGPADDIATWDDATAHAVAVTAAARFGPEAQKVVAATDPARVLRQEIWTVPRLRTWQGSFAVDGRTIPAILTGDAAHAMCPNLGRGACESLVDAAALATELNRLPPNGSVTSALTAYAKTRQTPARRIQLASRAVLTVSTLRRGGAIRNAILRAVAPRGRPTSR